MKTYLEEWLALARAVTSRVPEAKFGMPDVASNVAWLAEIADSWPSIKNPPNVTTLTHHYYFGGPATNPEVNIPNLLKPATMARVQKTADTATDAANKMGVRVRMTEGNTCYRGGKPDVSDVFAAALWAADYSLLLASNNYSGVNLHGGTGQTVANGVGGFLPGDILLKQKGESPEQIATEPDLKGNPRGSSNASVIMHSLKTTHSSSEYGHPTSARRRCAHRRRQGRTAALAKDLRIPYKPRAYPAWKSQSVASREQSPNFRGAKCVHSCRPGVLACVASSGVSIGF